MDDLAKFNKERWEELAGAGIIYSIPKLDLDVNSARELVDPEGMMDDPTGKQVLCLAGGGDQQSAALGLLGADVTVLDFCETQLERDREAALHYGLDVRTVLGDMRDLSCFDDDGFDMVWHGHSLNFVPDAGTVFDEVTRVLRAGGQYRMTCWNPAGHGLDPRSWNGTGYVLTEPYEEGKEVHAQDPFWDLVGWDGEGSLAQWAKQDHQDEPKIRIRGPREFRHTLGTVVNGLISRGFTIEGLWEEDLGEIDAEPGSWDHFKAYLPPWIALWAKNTG